ncbi:MAG: hypothetical protein P9L94_00465 [Candidatus Hinthialibacter antarcticus]|nr:hypothetical protein [Candidatus Hinthialibacter antarcticus]
MTKRLVFSLCVLSCLAAFAYSAAAEDLRLDSALLDDLSAPAQLVVVPSTPAMTILPATFAAVFENEPVTFQLEATGGASSQPYVFFVSPTIPNARLNAQTGVYRFLPNFIQAATYTVEFSADNLIDRVSKTATIQVKDNNRPPELQISFANTLSVNEGASVQFEAVAIDPDIDNTLVFSVTPAVANLHLATDTGEFLFQPDYFQAGGATIVISVTDGTQSVSQTRILQINNVNRSPQLSLNPEGKHNVQAGDTFNLLAFASDPDLEILDLSATGLPLNSTFDRNTGRFRFTPKLNQFRQQFQVNFTLTDGAVTVHDSVDLEVGADVSHIWEFNTPNDFEGWRAFQHISNLAVSNGFLEGTVTGNDPILFRSGLNFDTFSQFEMVMRFFMTPVAPIDVSFITDQGSFVGPKAITGFNAFGYQTVTLNYSDLFDQTKVIETLRIDPGFIRASSFSIDYIGIVRSKFPQRTPTPVPSPTFTPTPTPTPMPTLVATPTPTPGPPTQTPTPSPTPNPNLALYTFENSARLTSQFTLNAPQNFKPATGLISVSPDVDGFSGKALKVVARPGEGMMIVANTPVTSKDEPLWANVAAWVDSSSATISLMAFNWPVDNQFGYNMSIEGAMPTGVARQLTTIYDPPGDMALLALQITQPADANHDATVFFDNLQAQLLGEFDRVKQPLQPEGSFNTNLNGLIINLTNNKGGVQIIRDLFGNQSIALSSSPSAPSANVGVFSTTSQDAFNQLQMAQVDVKRLNGRDGMIDYIFTDGRSAFGLVANGRLLRTSVSTRLTIGGRIFMREPYITPILLLQNAGPFAATAINADEFTQFTINRLR